jgi:hypothetical protein
VVVLVELMAAAAVELQVELDVQAAVAVAAVGQAFLGELIFLSLQVAVMAAVEVMKELQTMFKQEVVVFNQMVLMEQT